MKTLWDFYENLNEIVYVSDMDTYDLIYMNKKAREIYGLSSQEEVCGQKCYQLLQGNSSPCSMCTNSILQEGQFHEWKYFNPIIRRTLVMKDTMLHQENHRFRLQLTVDVTDHEKQKLELRDYISHESFINDTLRLALSAPTPAQSLNVLLEQLGQTMECERVYIFEETSMHTFNNTYEWCSADVTPQKDNLQNVPYAAVSIWYESFLKNQNVIIKDIEMIRHSDPAAYAYLVPQDIHSLVVSPLIFKGEILGFYGVDNPPQNHLNHISTMFQVLGHFITSILRRRDLVKKLESLSYYDQLTGALNRHGMTQHADSLPIEKSLSLCYCDVLGLKKVNDSFGHAEGDALLIRTFQCLKKHFPMDTIFRLGGDEFLISIPDITEEDFLMRLQSLKQDMERFQISLSLGPLWIPAYNGNFTELLMEADHLMYDEKRRYYESKR